MWIDKCRVGERKVVAVVLLVELFWLTLHWGPSKGRLRKEATRFAVCLVLENGE